MDMHNDISKRTVLVLLILTLVVSVVGTWTILSMPRTIVKDVHVKGPVGAEVGVYLDAGEPTPIETTAKGAEVGVYIAK